MAFIPTILSNLFSSSAIGAINDNFNKIKNELALMFRRDGTTTMQGNLDMDSFRVINHGFPAEDNDLATLLDVKAVAAGIARGDKGEKGDPGLVQDFLGTSTTFAPSQKATSDALALKASTSLSNLGAVNSQFDSDSSFAPIGNTPTTFGRWNSLYNDKYDGQREFMVSYGGNFRHGGSGDPDFQWDKVLQYRGVTVGGTVKNAWIGNDLLELLPGSAINYVNGYELDINPNAGSYGTAIAGPGLSSPSVHAVTLNGYSAAGNTITSAITLISSSPSSNPLFERGFVAGPGAVRQAAFDDYSAATTSYRDSGVHTVGIDLVGTYSAAALRVPNGVSICSRTTGGANIRLINFDSSNNLRLGQSGSTANVVSEASLFPIADNSFVLGTSANRWSAVYAATGTINTSDPTLKTALVDVDSDASGAFVDSLKVQTGRWISGGKVPVKTKEVQSVLVRTETETVTMQSKNGSDVEVEVSVPVYEDQEVEVVTGWKDQKGVRTHAWIMAPSVKAAGEAAGIDNFGGYVKAEDGIEGNRTDEIVAMMAAELQSLRKRVAAIELKA